MSDLKPCPFCGGKMDGYPDYTISFKRDRRKVHGIYYEVCTLHCNRCTCTIQQAGATREEAEKHAYNVWNRRVPEEQQMLVLSPDLTDEQVRDLFDKLRNIQPTVIGAHLTDVDLMELRDRFGKDVADVVADMISGEEKRWNHE